MYTDRAEFRVRSISKYGVKNRAAVIFVVARSKS
jgi:hypothetical protein